MKLIASICSLLLVGAVSVWLLFTQGPSDVVATGADVGAAGTEAGPEAAPGPEVVAAPEGGSPPLITDEYAAAFVGLQVAFDVWRAQPANVLSDPDLLAGALAQARDSVADAADEQERERAAEAKRVEEEARKAKEEENSRTVVPQPVSPPDYDDDWDDDDWDDDDWDDDWDDDDWDD